MSITVENRLGEERVEETAKQTSCDHCGEVCDTELIAFRDKHFCCVGCKTVYEILSDNQLETFYQLEEKPGLQLRGRAMDDYAWLEEEEAISKLVDYQDEQLIKVTLHLPQIHCTSCVWLLEHLYRLDEGVLRSQVNFLAREAYIQIDPRKLSLRELVEILARIGYAPRLQLDKLSEVKAAPIDRTFSYQLGVAGFAFGNIMLLSFPEYLGLQETTFQRWFGYLNILLSIPVVVFSARSYWLSAWHSLKQYQLNIDVPISLGVGVLFLRSVFEIISHTGAGYLDSLAGLVFFLLIGRWFQQRTYNHLSFERNYQSYFPIAVLREERDHSWKSVTLDELRVGDVVRVQNNGLLPADGILVSGDARLDYSFVTGEADPIRKDLGEQVFAGGRQTGGQIDVCLTKTVSQSYLTQLWNDEAFNKDYATGSSQMLTRVGKYFTPTVLLIAFSTLIYWWPIDHRTALHAFTAVLIIACPCALALSVPFTLGNALRLLGKGGVYFKNTAVLEALHEVDTVVFDKTGTLTERVGKLNLQYDFEVSEQQQRAIKSLAAQSGHPISQRLTGEWPGQEALPVTDFEELAGKGISGMVEGQLVKIGSPAFIQNSALAIGTWAEVDGTLVGPFRIQHTYRKGVGETLNNWGQSYELFLLSGDNDAARSELERYFAADHLHFEQSPHDKLAFIKGLQDQGHKVLMIGDGLNDAGALQQSDVGMVVTEDVNNFTPACDIILSSRQFAELQKIMRYGSATIGVVYLAFILAFIYNVVGLSFAVQGLLSPLIAAILMPLSSITIAVVGVVGSSWLFRRFLER